MPSNALLANKPASPLDAFTTWSRERGVRIDGVTAAESPGRGRGIVAQRRIEVSYRPSALYISRLQHAESGIRPAKRSSMYQLQRY